MSEADTGSSDRDGDQGELESEADVGRGPMPLKAKLLLGVLLLNLGLLALIGTLLWVFKP